MGRPKLKTGELGSITTRQLKGVKPLTYEARSRVRTVNGEVVQVKGRGRTAEAAREALRDNARRRAYAGVPGSIDNNTTMTQLVTRVLEYLRSTPAEIRPQTVDQYDTVLPIIRGDRPQYPAIGDLPLGSIDSPDVIHGWLFAVSEVSPSTGKRCKAVLVHAFDMAMRHGAKPWKGDENPAKKAALAKPKRKPTKAPTKAEIKGVRAAVKTWQTPMKRTDLISIVNMLVATGARPNEVLGLRWEDVDLAVSPATVTINGTLVELAGTKAQGGGIVWQPVPKTKDSWRKLLLPEWAATMLMGLRIQSTNEKVFPSETGGWLSERNIGTRFREARGETYKHITLYSFRRAVATAIERKVGLEQAADQLGHGSPSITKIHYVERASQAGDFTGVLDEFAP